MGTKSCWPVQLYLLYVPALYKGRMLEFIRTAASSASVGKSFLTIDSDLKSFLGLDKSELLEKCPKNSPRPPYNASQAAFPKEHA
ncbi:hypothetical protein ACP70R_047411 [Stipagrostis hirtigluma subsp. patula]